MVLSYLLAGWLGLSAHATISYTDFGSIPQGGAVFAVEHVLTDINSPITGVELTLHFNDSASLSGNSSGIQGHLVLGTGSGSQYVDFFPETTYVSGQSRVYDVTFSGAPGNPGAGFNDANGNNTWGLVLWDNSNSGIQNALNGWSLDIQAVPEPVNEAIGLFVAFLVVVGLVGSQRVRQQLHCCRGLPVRLLRRL